MTDAANLTIAIIGAGPLGRSLALRAALAGFTVVLEDVMPSNLRHAQEALRASLGASLLASPLEPHNALSPDGQQRPPVRFASTVEDAVREADIAIDCVPDELESKLEIFSLLDRMAPPRTILLTPTTALSIADLASCTYRADRCVAVALRAEDIALDPGTEKTIPLVCTQKTDPAVIAQVVNFWKRLGCAATVEIAPAG